MITKTKTMSRIELTYLAVVATSILLAVALFIMPLREVRALPAGDTFTVTNTNDSGAGSLRQAIADANSNANPSEQDMIEFNIAGAGDKTIEPLTTLSITEPVLINGYTQGDATASTSTAPEPFNGVLRAIINLTTSGQIEVNSDEVTLQGLVIYGSPDTIVTVSGYDTFKLFGSYINVGPNGMVASSQSSYNDSSSTGGIVLDNSQNSQIGGSNPGERNVLGFCAGSCIAAINDSDGTIVKGNYVGIGMDGHTDISAGQDSTGILIDDGSDNTLIGGTSTGDDNIIAHLQSYALFAQDSTNLTFQSNQVLDQAGRGIVLEGVTNSMLGSEDESGRNIIGGVLGFGAQGLIIDDSTDTSNPSSEIAIQNNYFGVNWDGETPFNNNNGNILVQGNSQDIFIEGNVIKNANNFENNDSWQKGISVIEDSQDVTIINNSIYASADTGIDLGGNGGTDNDSDDSDSGPNGYLNFPDDLTNEVAGGNTELTYTLTVPAGDYRIDFFSNSAIDNSGYGEGETPIAFQEISHGGSGKESFTFTIPGTSFSNITATATEIDDGSPFGYGASSEFSRVAGDPLPVIDLGSTLTLDNPEDVAVGATLSYTSTIINHGEDSIDIGPFDGGVPGATSIVIIALAPDVTFVSNSGGNISCTSFGPGSASLFGPALANHSDYEIVSCGYMGGSTILEAGESAATTINVSVNVGSDLEFINYQSGALNDYDPEFDYIVNVSNSGNDIFDTYLSQYPPNNFDLAAYPIEDINITKTLQEPESLEVGSILTYDFTITNDGVAPFDISDYDGSGINPLLTALMVDVLPPELSYVGITDPNLSCQWAGVGSASLAYPLFANHSDYGLIVCGANIPITLDPNETYSFSMDVEVISEIEEDMANYVIGPGLGNIYDPDYLSLSRAITASYSGENGDFIDNLLFPRNQALNGLSLATYDFPDPEEPGGGDGGGQEGSNGGDGSEGGLAETGLVNGLLKTFAIIIFGAIVVLTALYTRKASVQIPTKEQDMI